jgi:MFS family permease
LKTQRRRYEILTIIGCCLIYAAISGVSANCKGVFYSPVAEGLGVSLSKLTFASFLSGIMSALCLSGCCAIFKRTSTRLSLTVFALIYTVSGMLMGSASSLGWYYAFTAIQGITSGFLLYFMLQHIIGNWFPDRKGTVLGAVLMSSGIMGMIFNPIITSWITNYGWRNAYRIQGVVMLVMILPATLFLLHRNPEEAGFEAAKPIPGAAPKSTEKVSLPYGRLSILLVLLLLLDLSMSLPQQMPSLALSVGRTSAFGAVLVSAAMFGNLSGKISLGVLNDRLGVGVTTIIGVAAVAIGCICVTSSSNLFMIFGAFLCGFIISAVVLQVPLIFHSMCGAAVYEKVYPTVCSINVIVSSGSQYLLSYGYNRFNSYTPVMLTVAVVMGICALITVILFSKQGWKSK